MSVRDKPPPASSASIKNRKNEPPGPIAADSVGGLQRSRSLQWRDQKHLEELAFRGAPSGFPTLKRAKSLTRLGVTSNEEVVLKKHLSSSNILALSDSTLSLKEALPVKLFSDKGSALGEEKAKLTTYAQMYYNQLTLGCEQHDCNSLFCRSSPNCAMINEDLQLSISVLLSMTKGRFMCSKRPPVRRVLPKVTEKINDKGQKSVKFLNKLFSMSSFSSLFQPIREDGYGDDSVQQAKATNLEKSSDIMKKEKSLMQWNDSKEYDHRAMILEPEHYVDDQDEDNSNFQGYQCDTCAESGSKPHEKEHFSLTHINISMLASVIEQYNNCGDDNFLKATVRTVFASTDALNQSFLDEDTNPKLIPGQSDLFDIDKCYQMLSDIDEKGDLFAEINSSTSILLSSLLLSVSKLGTSIVRPIIIVLKNPRLFESPEVPLRLCMVISKLGQAIKDTLTSVFCLYRELELDNLVSQFQKILSSITEVSSQCYEQKISVCETVALLYNATVKPRGFPLPDKHRLLFYNSNFSKSLDLAQELSTYKKSEQHKVNGAHSSGVRDDSWFRSPVVKFSFLLLPETKIQILHLEAMMQMKDQYQTALVHQVKIQHMHKVARGFNPSELSADVKSATCPYLVLNVSRENIVQGTLELLRKKEKDLKKPLKVVFTGKGEHGLDLGGLQKEFFQIFCQEVFNLDYGLFQNVGNNGYAWFSMRTIESSELFKVIGMVIGIAIYNGIILDVQFPPVLYRKLLGFKARLEDLEDIQPTVTRSLRNILTYDGDVESTFCLTFRVTEDLVGQVGAVDLIPNGENIPVTTENRERFVELYVDYLLTKSIQSQFSAFSEGFFKVCGDGAITLFHPYELELLICGSPDLDFHALEKVTTYYGMFSPSDPIIKEFWRIVHGLSDEQKHKLLNFVTGSHRVPVGGLGALSFAIQRSGSTDNLPTAMTCFNRLFLPNYSDKRILKTNLILAIENCQGFGLV